jgi:hypothetical protein
MRYGMEFSSKVTLIARSYSSVHNEIGIESIPKAELNIKIKHFLEKLLSD